MCKFHRCFKYNFMSPKCPVNPFLILLIFMDIKLISAKNISIFTVLISMFVLHQTKHGFSVNSLELLLQVLLMLCQPR